MGEKLDTTKDSPPTAPYDGSQAGLMDNGSKPDSSTLSKQNNVVLVGSKPLMNYVVACVTAFNQGCCDVIIKGRGQAISKVVDTVQVLRRAFISNLIIKDTKIGTEGFIREGRKTNVSIIEISIAKPQTR